MWPDQGFRLRFLDWNRKYGILKIPIFLTAREIILSITNSSFFVVSVGTNLRILSKLISQRGILLKVQITVCLCACVEMIFIADLLKMVLLW